MGQHLSPRYGQVILVSGYPVSTAVNWSQRWCPKCLHYQFSCAPKLATKYEIEHWCPMVRTDGRCTVTWLPNFLGWVDFLSYGAPPTRALRARGAPLSNSGYWPNWSIKSRCYWSSPSLAVMLLAMKTRNEDSIRLSSQLISRLLLLKLSVIHSLFRG